MGKKVLVTGATGLIGKELVQPLLEAGFEIHAITIDAQNPDNGIVWHNGSLFDSIFVHKVMQAVKPTHLLNMAWATTGDYLTSDINYRFQKAGEQLAREFIAVGGRRAVYAGTCFEYRFKDSPIAETDELDAEKNAYTHCKNALRQSVETLFEQSGVSFGYGRIFYVYGRNEAKTRLTGAVIDKLTRREKVQITAGPLMKDYIYAKDIAGAFVALLASEVKGAVNICTGKAITIREYVMTLARRIGRPELVEFKDDCANQPPIIVGDNTRLTREVGYKINWTLDEAVEDIVNPQGVKKTSTIQPKSERLFSLDVLRGLDMIFLCIVQPLIMVIAKGWGFADKTAHPFMKQFAHAWGGFSAYDLIMPLFIFMCGAAIPFALPKRLDANGKPTAAFWSHIAWRVIMLWFLGMVCQGRLRTYDPSMFVYYSNTLQAIAVGYVIAALVLLVRSRIMRITIPLALAAIYGALLHFGGDYSVQGNLAMKVDMFFVKLLQPCGHDTKSYTWYLTSLMFGAMTLCGMNCTFILKSGMKKWSKAFALFALGAALWAGGIGLEWLGIPCIKQIFTLSFTAQAMGVSVLLLAALYVINDIWKCRRGWWIVTLYGQAALAAYVIGEIFRGILKFSSQSMFGGFAKQVGGAWQPVIIELGMAAILTFCIWVWRKSQCARKK